MRPLTLAELDAESAAFDACVRASADIDHFCSASDWILPAAEALMPPRLPWLRQSEHGYVALMRERHPGGMVLQPLEAMWGLACPIVGAEVAALSAELSAELRATAPRDALMLCGLQQGTPRFGAVVRALGQTHRLRLGMVTRRFGASLAGGVDGFLSRRSANFRVALKRAQRRAEARQIRFVPAPVGTAQADADRAYDRLLAVEARSWKGRDEVGIASTEMLAFYRVMIRRLARRGALRLMFAVDGDTDVAYILGGLFGSTYRGLQFSFADGYDALSLGNLCQLEQIRALCDEGVTFYDLGAEVEYKRRWGETLRETVTLLAVP
ncbi:MAG TPA: GNAT family N-acetyltransferase [Kofleriaceae bacterium]|nr:GNAT family N-acetyltransferase [Kofleriaceae bacterium]